MNANQMNATCAICIETFNKTIRKKVTCNNCETDICAKCIKRYLAENLQQPCCMQCRSVYSTQFLDENFSKKYRKETLQNIRYIVLVEREKQNLPQLMLRVDAYVKYRAVKKNITELWTKYYKISTERNQLKQELLQAFTSGAFSDTRLAEIKADLITLETNLTSVHEEIKTLQVEEGKYINAYKHGVPLDVDNVIPCITLNCKGYLDNDYICRLCSVHVCKECHQECNGQHQCLPENVETVKSIKNDTHPCPNCQTRIFKIDGCDQIFCTQCHTAFSWTTGRIDTGRIHNPHYYQWIRTRNMNVPREAGDVPCGGFPTFKAVENKMIELKVWISHIIYVREILSFGKMVQTKEVSKYPVSVGRCKEMDLFSIQYIAGDITEKRWKQILYEKEVSKEINTERRLLFDMLLAVLIDYMTSILSMTDKQQIVDLLSELEEFRHYYNTCINNLTTSFPDAKFKSIRYDWSKFE